MIKLKKSWKDREGSVTLILGIVAVVAVIIAVAFVAISYMAAEAEKKTQGDLDLDGDGEEDPVIGYLSMSVEVKLDNSGVVGYTRTLQNLQCSLVDDKPSMQLFKLNLGWYDEFLTLKWEITGAQSGTELSSSQDIYMDVNGNSASTRTFTPTATFEMRYHGVYHVVVTLLDRDANNQVVTELAGDFTI